jgi:hypothetical protein
MSMMLQNKKSQGYGFFCWIRRKQNKIELGMQVRQAESNTKKDNLEAELNVAIKETKTVEEKLYPTRTIQQEWAAQTMCQRGQASLTEFEKI